MRIFILHIVDGSNKLVTEKEAIQNALDQEKSGVSPHYIWIDYKTGKKIGKPGWLVWSTHEDGAGVVYRRDDGKMIVTTGWQADFAYI